MAAATPHELAEAFAAALTRRDVAAALEMWSEDAAIVAADGSLVEGREAIGRALDALVSQRHAGAGRGRERLRRGRRRARERARSRSAGDVLRAEELLDRGLHARRGRSLADRARRAVGAARALGHDHELAGRVAVLALAQRVRDLAEPEHPGDREADAALFDQRDRLPDRRAASARRRRPRGTGRRGRSPAASRRSSARDPRSL